MALLTSSDSFDKNMLTLTVKIIIFPDVMNIHDFQTKISKTTVKLLLEITKWTKGTPEYVS